MNTKKNKTTEKKYILSADLPFGNLKRDTIFTYNAITKVASFPNGVQISDFDISNSKFVKKCVDISFSIDDIVLYDTRLYRITDINYITKDGYISSSLQEQIANDRIIKFGYSNGIKANAWNIPSAIQLPMKLPN